MAVAEKKPEKSRSRRREPAVRARVCWQCGSQRTNVVRTMRIVRYCKCQDCQSTWTQTPGDN